MLNFLRSLFKSPELPKFGFKDQVELNDDFWGKCFGEIIDKSVMNDSYLVAFYPRNDRMELLEVRRFHASNLRKI